MVDIIKKKKNNNSDSDSDVGNLEKPYTKRYDGKSEDEVIKEKLRKIREEELRKKSEEEVHKKDDWEPEF